MPGGLQTRRSSAARGECIGDAPSSNAHTHSIFSRVCCSFNQNLLDHGCVESEQDLAIVPADIYICASQCESSRVEGSLVIVEKGSIMPCTISHTLDPLSTTAFFEIYTNASSECLGRVVFEVPPSTATVRLDVCIQANGSMQLSVFAGSSLLHSSKYEVN
jgi:hypothetical protein